MAKNTVTFELGGRVDYKVLKDGITAFYDLIAVLTGKEDVSWLVEDLRPGSAVVTLQGEADDPATVERIVDRFGEIGRDLELHKDISDEHRATMAAVNAIRKLAGSMEYLRFQTPEADYTIYGNGTIPNQPTTVAALGAVTGRVQTLSSRGGLRFNLYDALLDKLVACYLAPGKEETMREAWGRRVTVSGQVSREVSTGRPVAVRQIMGVEILEDAEPGSYEKARGAVPWQEGDLLPEDAVRRLRDA